MMVEFEDLSDDVQRRTEDLFEQLISNIEAMEISKEDRQCVLGCVGDWLDGYATDEDAPDD